MSANGGGAARATSMALTIIATTCLVAALYFGKPLIVPVVLAIVLALLLGPAVDRLVRLRCPRTLATALVLGCMLAATSALFDAVWTPARAWLDAAPRTMVAIEAKVRPVQVLMRRLDRVGQSAQRLAGTGHAAAQEPHPEPARVALAAAAISVVPGALATAAMIVALTFLLLALGPAWIRQLRLPRDAGEGRSGAVLIAAIRVELSRYLAAIALINVGVGLAVALLATWFGLPNALLWGTLAALFNFIPYFGPLCTLITLVAIGLVNFNTLPPVLLLAGSFLLITSIEGQIIQPLVIGRRLQLNPIAVLLCMWLLWALWGIAGLVLAMPLLLTIKVFVSHVDAWRGLRPLIDAVAAPAPAPARGTRAASARPEVPGGAPHAASRLRSVL